MPYRTLLDDISGALNALPISLPELELLITVLEESDDSILDFNLEDEIENPFLKPSKPSIWGNHCIWGNH